MVGTEIVGAFGELFFEMVVLRFAVGEDDAPAVVMDHDGDVVGIVESCCAAIEGGIVEVPFG